jgi:hypothetical protein
MTLIVFSRDKIFVLSQHVDGAGKVDGSLVVALPIDRWSAPEHVNAFEGGGLTFWDGRSAETGQPQEIHYDTRSGDIALIDRCVLRKRQAACDMCCK